jgi:hypothetical protein
MVFRSLPYFVQAYHQQKATDRGPVFLRLANALSGLYLRASEENRLVDAMLLAYPK